jgi:hypothetical protein
MLSLCLFLLQQVQPSTNRIIFYASLEMDPLLNPHVIRIRKLLFRVLKCRQADSYYLEGNYFMM